MKFIAILAIIILSLTAIPLMAQASLVLDKVIIEGLKSVSAEEVIGNLNLVQGQAYLPELSGELKNGIQNYLEKEGFYFSTVRQKDILPAGENNVILVFEVEEGYAGTIHQLRFSGNRYFSSDKLKQILNNQTGYKLNLSELPELMQEITDLYNDRGYLFTEVSLDTLAVEDSVLTATVNIAEGPLFESKDYIFKGNKISKPSSLLRISGLNLYRQINLKALAQAEQNVSSKEYIKSCRLTPLDEETLEFQVEESSMSRLEGVLGLGSDPVTGKNKLTGYLNLRFLNLWGTDRAIKLYWKSLSSSVQTLELAYHESGLNRYPLAGDLGFVRSRQDSAWVRMKTNLSLYYNRPFQKAGFFAYAENLYPDAANTPGVDKASYYSLGAIWEYSGNDYLINATLANSFSARLSYLYRQAEGREKYIPVTELDAAAYIPIYKRIVHTTGLHYREISDRRAKSYEQYKLGGFNSVRGYNEDTFSSWRTAWMNNEINYLLSRESRIFLLFDNGLVMDEFNQAKTDIMGAGMGISLASRLGIIQVSYALPVADKGFSSISSGLLHLGLSTSF